MNASKNPDACIADDEGRPCAREAAGSKPVPLCHAHRIEIALTVVPELLRDGLESALAGGVSTGLASEELTGSAVSTPISGLLDGVHESVVYFIANGGRVKIGYTTNLKSRLGALALRSDSVLLALRGGPPLERALHAKFAAYRNGSTEWFELSPELFRYASERSGVTAYNGSDQRISPSVADLAREQVAITEKNSDAVAAILAIRPDAPKQSVAAAVRKARKASDGPYL